MPCSAAPAAGRPVPVAIAGAQAGGRLCAGDGKHEQQGSEPYFAIDSH
jgi:hypothetical protein